MKSPPSGDQSPLVFGKGLKASGNGSLLDFSTSFRQPPGGEEADKQRNAERELEEKKRKEKKKREKEKNYAEAYGRKIDWTGRDLKVLPEKLYEFANFDGLTKLVVRANQLSAFPGELSMLRGLTYLDYSGNLIKGACGTRSAFLLNTKQAFMLTSVVCVVSCGVRRAAQGDGSDASIEGAAPRVEPTGALAARAGQAHTPPGAQYRKCAFSHPSARC
jgi:hypothetical protein